MVVDIIVLAVLFISAVISFIRGLIRETLTILGMAGGFLAAYNFGDLLRGPISNWLGVDPEAENVQKLMGFIPLEWAAGALSFGLVFIVVVVALSLLSHFLAEGVKDLGLGAIDRTLGVIFGLLRGVLVLGILYLPFYMLMDGEAKKAWFGDSRTHFYLEGVSGALAAYVPGGSAEGAEKMAQDIESALSARDKLEQIDLLKKKDGVDGGEGYSDDFRDQMNKLFEDKTGGYNE